MSPTQQAWFDDLRVFEALREENSGPAEQRIAAIRRRCKQAGYPVGDEPASGAGRSRLAS